MRIIHGRDLCGQIDAAYGPACSDFRKVDVVLGQGTLADIAAFAAGAVRDA